MSIKHNILLSLFSLLLVFGAAHLSTAKAADETANEQSTDEESADKKSAREKAVEELDAEMKAANRARRKAAEKAKEILESVQEGLKPREKNHLFITYSNYNIIETVRTVQTDVSNAVDACTKKNPDMKEDMDTRFKAWSDVVDPLLEEATANLNNMVLAQEYTSKQKMDEIFAAVDEARESTSSHIQKIPVTTPEACEYMLNKMDETQETMTGLLRSTLISYPRSFSKTPEELFDDEEDKPDAAPEKSDETNT